MTEATNGTSGIVGVEPTPEQEGIIFRVLVERARQDAKWGIQNHDDTLWALILGEEFGETQKEVLERECSYGEKAEAHDARIEREVLQLVAVGLSWLEARARRRCNPGRVVVPTDQEVGARITDPGDDGSGWG